MLYRWFFFISILGLIQWYSFQCIKTVSQNKYFWVLYGSISLFIIGNFIFQMLNYDRSVGFTHVISYSFGFFISLFVFQSILVVSLFFEDLLRFDENSIFIDFSENSLDFQHTVIPIFLHKECRQGITFCRCQFLIVFLKIFYFFLKNLKNMLKHDI